MFQCRQIEPAMLASSNTAGTSVAAELKMVTARRASSATAVLAILTAAGAITAGEANDITGAVAIWPSALLISSEFMMLSPLRACCWQARWLAPARHPRATRAAARRIRTAVGVRFSRHRRSLGGQRHRQHAWRSARA